MRLLYAATAVVGVVLLFPALSSAQAKVRSAGITSATPSPTVVVLDVALVFKNHARFKLRMEEVRRDIERFEKDYAQQRQEIVARGEKLSNFKSGSAQYKQIEAQIARELSEQRIKALAKKNEILEREGKIYYETYQEIVAAVARLAGQYNISLVVRYDSEATDPLDRGSILKAINRDVVYQRNLDITKLVIEQFAVASVASAEAGRTAGSKQSAVTSRN